MTEFLSGIRTEIFKKTDVLDARIAFEVEDALGGEAKEVSNFIIGGVPKMTVVVRVLNQDFMGADRMHAVVDAIATASGLAFNAV